MTAESPQSADLLFAEPGNGMVARFHRTGPRDPSPLARSAVDVPNSCSRVILNFRPRPALLGFRKRCRDKFDVIPSGSWKGLLVALFGDEKPMTAPSDSSGTQPGAR